MKVRVYRGDQLYSSARCIHIRPSLNFTLRQCHATALDAQSFRAFKVSGNSSRWIPVIITKLTCNNKARQWKYERIFHLSFIASVQKCVFSLHHSTLMNHIHFGWFYMKLLAKLWLHRNSCCAAAARQMLWNLCEWNKWLEYHGKDKASSKEMVKLTQSFL